MAIILRVNEWVCCYSIAFECLIICMIELTDE